MDKNDKINTVGLPHISEQEIEVQNATCPSALFSSSTLEVVHEDSGHGPLHITIKDSKIDENGLTENEKILLQRGINLYGSRSPCHVVNDSQIPSTSKELPANDMENVKSSKKPDKTFKIPTLKVKTTNKRKQRRKKIKKKTSVEDNQNLKKNVYGEIVLLKKNSESSDSEEEIDIEDDCDNKAKLSKKTEHKDFQQKVTQNTVFDQLSSLEEPQQAVNLDINSPTELEKFVFEMMFPENFKNDKKHYLNLRNTIVQLWNEKKGRYLTRNEAKRNFRPCDQKNVGRIHCFLEQIGAINFGCTKVEYIRPLNGIFRDALYKSVNPSKRKRKHKFENNGEGGCTFHHGPNGEIVDTTVIKEDGSSKKSKRVKNRVTKLICCEKYASEEMFKVKLNLPTLLLLDFHAHSSVTEVMGLIGGSWDAEERTMVISHYEPCKSLAASTTHCDMCPVSQYEATQTINKLNLDLLGWFHSHPLFPPEPSHQDVETQSELQEWIGKDKPCVGLILSPFNTQKDTLTPSEYRCIIVGPKEGSEVTVPFRIEVEVLRECFDSQSYLSDVIRLRNFIVLNSGTREEKFLVNFKKPYIYDPNINYLEKFLSTAKLTLERYMPELESRDVIQLLSRVCNEET